MSWWGPPAGSPARKARGDGLISLPSASPLRPKAASTSFLSGARAAVARALTPPKPAEPPIQSRGDDAAVAQLVAESIQRALAQRADDAESRLADERASSASALRQEQAATAGARADLDRCLREQPRQLVMAFLVGALVMFAALVFLEIRLPMSARPGYHAPKQGAAFWGLMTADLQLWGWDHFLEGVRTWLPSSWTAGVPRPPTLVAIS